MTKNERIAELERKVTELEARIAILEARPAITPLVWPDPPMPYPIQPVWGEYRDTAGQWYYDHRLWSSDIQTSHPMRVAVYEHGLRTYSG